MFRSSTTYARRFLCIASAALGVLAAAATTGCSHTMGDGRPAFASNLDNPVHTRFEQLHVSDNFPATSSALGSEAHSAPNRLQHVSAVPR